MTVKFVQSISYILENVPVMTTFNLNIYNSKKEKRKLSGSSHLLSLEAEWRFGRKLRVGKNEKGPADAAMLLKNDKAAT